MLFAGFASVALGNLISGTPHDFTDVVGLIYLGEPDSTCYVCHFPHTRIEGQSPKLWRRDLTEEENYFSQNTSPTYAPYPTRLCYDCHSGSTVDDEPSLLLYPFGRLPKDMAFGGDGTSTTGVVGYYENDPVDGTTPTAAEIQGGTRITGGHFIKTAPTAGAESGDKLPCNVCHSVHNSSAASTGTANEVFIKPVLGGKAVSGLTAASQVTSESGIVPGVGSRNGTGNGREICTTCHGYDDFGQPDDTASVTLTEVFESINDSITGGEIVRRPNTVPAHAPDDPNQTPCVYCHGHNEIAASCNSCHGFPPKLAGVDDTGTRGYTGAIGAHTKHTDDQNYNCIVCHGNNGSGLEHGGSVGRTTVERENVNMVFDASQTFPGGTTMDNGLDATETTSSGSITCNVGCHNPIIWYPSNETPNLSNSIEWSDSNLACGDCHDLQGASMDRETTGGITYKSSHRVDTSGRADCLVCHELENHTQQETLKLINNDNSSTISWDRSLSSSDTTVFESFCLSCHDADGNTPFSTTQTPANVEAGWSAAAHKTGNGGAKQYSCFGSGDYTDGVGCHNNPHGSPNDKLIAAPSTTPTVSGFCYKCHTEGKVMNNAVSGSSLADDIQQAFSLGGGKHDIGTTFTVSGKTFTLECTSCHNPHTATGKYWEADTSKTAVTRPDFTRDASDNPRAMGSGIWGADSSEKIQYYAGIASGIYQKPFVSSNTYNDDKVPDYVTFCLSCHSNAVNGISAKDWTNNPHGKKTAGLSGMITGGGVDGLLYGGPKDAPDWKGAGRAIDWGTDRPSPSGSVDDSFPVIPRGWGTNAWVRGAYDQELRNEGINYVLNCTDCHEGHGSSNYGMLRKALNREYDQTDTPLTNDREVFDNPGDGTIGLCEQCHQERNTREHSYNPGWHNNSVCATAPCHVGDEQDHGNFMVGAGGHSSCIGRCHSSTYVQYENLNNNPSHWATFHENRRMGNNSQVSPPYEPGLALWYKFENNLKDSNAWNLHGISWNGAAAYTTGKVGNGVSVSDKPIEVGTEDYQWGSTEYNSGGPKGNTSKLTEMKYNTSVEAWINPTSDASDGLERKIAAKHTYWDGGYSFVLRPVGEEYRVGFITNMGYGGPTTGWDVDTYNTNGLRGAYSSISIPKNQWTHVAATFDTSGSYANPGDPTVGKIRIYVNGEDVTTSDVVPGGNPAWAEPQDPADPFTYDEEFMTPLPIVGDKYPSRAVGWLGSAFSVGGLNWSAPDDNFIGKLDEFKLWYTTKDADYFDEQAGPCIKEVVGMVGSSTLTVTFSEETYANTGQTGSLQPSDFTITDTDNSRTIAAVTHTAGSDTALVQLSAPLDGTDDIDVDTLAPATDSIYDDYDNEALINPMTITLPSNDPPNPTIFNLNETTGSPYVSDNSFTMLGTVSNPTDTIGGGYLHGDSDTATPDNYIDFTNNLSALSTTDALTLEARVKPHIVDLDSPRFDTDTPSWTYSSVFERKNSYQLRMLRADYMAADFGPGEAAYMFKYRSVDRWKPFAKWKQAVTDIENYPILADHWYQIKITLNTDYFADSPLDIFVDDQGIDGYDTSETWSGYKNVTLPQKRGDKWQADWANDVVTDQDDASYIGTPPDHNPLFIAKEGLIDWVKVDVENKPDPGVQPTSATAFASGDTSDGIQANDTVVIKFTGSTDATDITSGNIDGILKLDNGHSWLDGFGSIGSANWSTDTYLNDTLTITLSSFISSPTVDIGDKIRIDGGIADAFGVPIDTYTPYIGGTFGSDAYEIISATAYDSSGGGAGIQAGDKAVIKFNGRTAGSTITTTDIDTALYAAYLTSKHTWLDGSGNYGSVAWSTDVYPNDTLTVTLSDTSSVPSVAGGDMVSIYQPTAAGGLGESTDTPIIYDGLGLPIFDRVLLGGSF